MDVYKLCIAEQQHIPMKGKTTKAVEKQNKLLFPVFIYIYYIYVYVHEKEWSTHFPHKIASQSETRKLFLLFLIILTLVQLIDSLNFTNIFDTNLLLGSSQLILSLWRLPIRCAPPPPTLSSSKLQSISILVLSTGCLNSNACAIDGSSYVSPDFIQ